MGTNGQYIAAASQGRGEVNMWNINNSQRHASLRAFQGICLFCHIEKKIHIKRSPPPPPPPSTHSLKDTPVLLIFHMVRSKFTVFLINDCEIRKIVGSFHINSSLLGRFKTTFCHKLKTQQPFLSCFEARLSTKLFI